jgi:hypothetical protein
MRFLAFALALAAGLVSTPALAWGAYGHATTASIAMANVRPQTRARIDTLLAKSAVLRTPKCPMRTLEEAAVWPDCVRNDRVRWGYTFPWHYQTQPVCEAFDAKKNCANGTCVTGQIERDRAILADRSQPDYERVQALAFLVHFVGDVHMPLHSGDNGDLGGNTIDAMYGIAPGRNLHAIWDGALAERAISSARPPLILRYSGEEKATIATGEVGDWARESWQLARDFVYPAATGELPCEGSPESVVWSNAAIEAAIPIVDERIVQAGLRAAHLLDQALG